MGFAAILFLAYRSVIVFVHQDARQKATQAAAQLRAQEIPVAPQTSLVDYFYFSEASHTAVQITNMSEAFWIDKANLAVYDAQGAVQE